VVGVAQQVERRVVVADVAGSSPVTHPQGVDVTYVTPGQAPDSRATVRNPGPFALSRCEQE
jgi:hypothetical protein